MGLKRKNEEEAGVCMLWVTSNTTALEERTGQSREPGDVLQHSWLPLASPKALSLEEKAPASLFKTSPAREAASFWPGRAEGQDEEGENGGRGRIHTDHAIKIGLA